MKIWIKLLVGSLSASSPAFSSPRRRRGSSIRSRACSSGSAATSCSPSCSSRWASAPPSCARRSAWRACTCPALKYLALSAGLLVVIGTLSVLVFPPERIPITVEAEKAFVPVNIMDGLRAIFPRNLFSVFWGSGDFLLPLMVLAFLLGVNMDFDRQLTRPIVQIFDSLSRIFYHLNSLVVELFGIAMIVDLGGVDDARSRTPTWRCTSRS